MKDQRKILLVTKSNHCYISEIDRPLAKISKLSYKNIVEFFIGHKFYLTMSQDKKLYSIGNNDNEQLVWEFLMNFKLHNNVALNLLKLVQIVMNTLFKKLKKLIYRKLQAVYCCHHEYQDDELV